MEDHENVVLQQWVRAGAIENTSGSNAEWICRTQGENEEENANEKHGGHRPAHHGVIHSFAIFECNASSETCEHQDPHEDGAFKCAPHCSEVVHGWRAPRANLLNVCQREISRDHCPFHASECSHCAKHGEPRKTRQQTENFFVFVMRARNGRHHSEECANKSYEECGAT